MVVRFNDGGVDKTNQVLKYGKGGGTPWVPCFES
jgi:hypothetical protein